MKRFICVSLGIFATTSISFYANAESRTPTFQEWICSEDVRTQLVEGKLTERPINFMAASMYCGDAHLWGDDHILVKKYKEIFSIQ